MKRKFSETESLPFQFWSGEDCDGKFDILHEESEMVSKPSRVIKLGKRSGKRISF